MNKQRLTVLCLVILITGLVFAVAALFKPYVSGTADGLGHRFRLVSFSQSLKDGIIRPRWAGTAALGFGAPTFLFNYPLPYYLGSLFMSLGIGVNQSGQLLAASALFLSGLFMFLAGRACFGNLGGLVAGIIYTFAPYHLQMTYLYDSWGEEIAFIFPPLILYLSIRLIGQIGRIRYFTGLVFAWFLFILSHNVSVLMFTPVLIFLSFLIVRNDPPAGGSACHPRGVLTAFVLAILLSAFFWLPAVILQQQMKYPVFMSAEGVMRGSFFKSISSQVETAFRVIREWRTHYLDFTIGLPILLIGLIVPMLFPDLIGITASWIPLRGRLISLIRNIPMRNEIANGITTRTLHLLKNFRKLSYDRYSRKSINYWSASWRIGLSILLLVSVYLTNYASNWFWQFIPFTYILYPFRFLFAASFLGALLGGLIARKNIVFASGLIVLAVVQGVPFLNPYADIFPFPDSYFYQKQTVSSAPGTRKNMLVKEFLPVYADAGYLEKLESRSDERTEAYLKEKGGQIEIVSSHAEKLELKFSTDLDDTLVINRLYFPNWNIFLDGKEGRISKDEIGRIAVDVPRGSHKVELIFGISEIEKIAYLISIAGIVIFIGTKWKY